MENNEKMKIVRYTPLTKIENANLSQPVLVVTKNKIYIVSSWQEAFQIALFNCCYKTNHMDAIEKDAQHPVTELNGKTLIFIC